MNFWEILALMTTTTIINVVTLVGTVYAVIKRIDKDIVSKNDPTS